MAEVAERLEETIDATLTQGEFVISVVDRWLRGNFCGATLEQKFRVAEAVFLDEIVQHTETRRAVQEFFCRRQYGADLLEVLQRRFEGEDNGLFGEREQRLFLHLAGSVFLAQFIDATRWATIRMTAEVLRVQLGLSSKSD